LDRGCDGIDDPDRIAVSGDDVWVVNGDNGGNTWVTELNASNGSLMQYFDTSVDGLDGPVVVAVRVHAKLDWSEKNHDVEITDEGVALGGHQFFFRVTEFRTR
jgi:hypothetical protein